MIWPAVRLWFAMRRPWRCDLPDSTGHPCGTRGWGTYARQQHDLDHRAARCRP